MKEEKDVFCEAKTKGRFKHRKTLIALAVGAMAAGNAHAQLEEIIVTATKRAESSQDIPVAINAITGESMDKLGINTFDEYIKYLPNVVQQGRGPGRSEIYIRGSATEAAGLSVSSVQGSAPAVALYLDEQPVSFGQRNLDIYAADLKRVEVLPGPQGTLFGASSQSGTVRLITNKPSTEGFDSSIKAGYSTTSGGDPSANLEAAFNVPLSDKVAARAVIYTDKQGGWIDNTPTRFNPNSEELVNVLNRAGLGFLGFARLAQDADVDPTDNSDVVRDDWNEATYTGARLGLSWDVNEDWNLLLQHTDQDITTEGSFEYGPTTGTTHQSQSFVPEHLDDSFGLTTWTAKGRIGALDLVYTGGFLDRDIDSLIDYTTYSFGGAYQVFYNSSYYLAGGRNVDGLLNQTFDFTKQFVERTSNERFSNEIRIQGEVGERFQFTAGAFFDDVETHSLGQFQYFGAADAGFDTAVLPANLAPGTSLGTMNRFGPPAESIFINNFTREEDQTAFFLDASFDISDTVTISAGARSYDIDFALRGATGAAFGACAGADPSTLPLFDGTANATGTTGPVAVPRADGSLGCSQIRGNNVTQRLINLGTFGALSEGGAPVKGVGNLDSNGVANQSDTIFRLTADWKLSDDVLVYATWSEGFRPQTVNRNAGNPASSANQPGPFFGFVVPPVAETDELTNTEIGIKGDFFDSRLRLNATIYRSEIDELQTSRFDPINVGFLVFIENVGDAEVQGLDADFIWAVNDNLTISGAAAFVDSEITRLNKEQEGISAPVGSKLPYVSDFSFNVRGRYEFELASVGAQAYVQGGVVYRGDSLSGIIGNANLIEDNVRRIYGRGSGLQIENHTGSFGSSAFAAVAPGSSGLTADGQFFQNGRYVQEAYSIVNVSAGFDKDNWGLELYVNNLFDEDGVVNVNTADYTPKVSVSRPRSIGMRFRWDYN